MLPLKEMMLESPNVPHDYPNNAYTLWDIQAPEGYIIKIYVDQFEIQENHDYIYFGDGVHNFSTKSVKWTQLTGKIRDIWMKRSFYSTSRTFTIIFTSDGAITELGFVIRCSAVDLNRTNRTGNIVFIIYNP